MQSKLDSVLEAAISTLIGFVIQYVASYFFLHMIGITITGGQNLVFGFFMMFISFVRQYTLRRLSQAYLTKFRVWLVEFLKKEVA